MKLHRFSLIILFVLFAGRVGAQPYYRVVSDNPSRLRSAAFTMFGYGDFWRTNPSGGLGFGLMFHMKGVFQLEYDVHFSTAERFYNKDLNNGLGRLVGCNGLLGVRLAYKDAAGRATVRVNGQAYTMSITKRNQLWMRGGYSGIGSQYDEAFNASYTDSTGQLHTVSRNYMFDGYVAFGLAWKQTQNAWIEIGGGLKNPVSVGQYSEFYFDVLMLAGLNMGDVDEGKRRYKIQPGPKNDFGWRMGFRMMTSVTSGFLFGLEGGMRPGPASVGGKSRYERNAYFVITLGLYLAPGKRGK